MRRNDRILVLAFGLIAFAVLTVGMAVRHGGDALAISAMQMVSAGAVLYAVTGLAEDRDD